MEPKRSTYSMWSMFRNCRRMAYYRYVRELVPVAAKAPALWFGTLIHDCLESWHAGHGELKLFEHIDQATSLRERDPGQKSMWHLARAMMLAYVSVYKREPFEVRALEQVFSVPLKNPTTGAASRTFTLDGKVDGIVEQDGKVWLLEHKTASSVDGGYLEKLWCDFQIHLYAHALEAVGVGPIYGCIYNVALKSRIQQSLGETEAEFELRRDQLIAASKSGTSAAKRRMPETDETFASRLDEWYAESGRFHRERIIFDRSRWPELQEELWELSKQWLDAARRKVWYQNTSQCFAYNRPCNYFPICRAGGNELVCANLFEKKAPHSELTTNEGTSESPVF